MAKSGTADDSRRSRLFPPQRKQNQRYVAIQSLKVAFVDDLVNAVRCSLLEKADAARGFRSEDSDSVIGPGNKHVRTVVLDED